MNQYQIGDLVLYGSTGVCRVTELQARKGPPKDGERLFYTLEPLYQSCTISTPVDSDKVFMRPILSREEAEHLIDWIPNIRAKAFHSRAMRELTEHYEAALKSHDCAELVELTMSIYAKKQEMEDQKRKFGALDERFLRRAEELLYGELAAALGLDREAVPGYIAARVGALGGESLGGT